MPDERSARYQVDGSSAKLAGGVLLGVLGLIPLAVVIVVAMFAAFQGMARPRPVTDLQRTPLTPTGPKLEVAPRQDRLALERAARARIGGYSWADRQAGLARIPIERAMALQAERGWPETAAEATP